MASKKDKDIAEIKSSIQQINLAIADIRDSVIKALLNENALLKNRAQKLEVEIAETSQYLRRSNIVISRIPCTNDKHIESTVIEILDGIQVPVSPRDIEAVHRIRKAKVDAIVRLVNRKDVEMR